MICFYQTFSYDIKNMDGVLLHLASSQYVFLEYFIFENGDKIPCHMFSKVQYITPASKLIMYMFIWVEEQVCLFQ